MSWAQPALRPGRKGEVPARRPSQNVTTPPPPLPPPPSSTRCYRAGSELGPSPHLSPELLSPKALHVLPHPPCSAQLAELGDTVMGWMWQ